MVLDFTNRPQKVPVGQTSSTVDLNTGAPPGLCTQPPPVHGENSIVKFEDDAAIIRWITNNFQRSHCVAIDSLAEFCTENNLLLKIKELIVDFRGEKRRKRHRHLSTSGELR